jgi:hypothetical protein
MNTKKYYFNQLFIQYEVSAIDNFLKTLLKIKNLHFYKEHIKFRRNASNSKYINFEKLGKKQSVIVKYLSIYNDYIWIINGRYKFEHLGYIYTKIHNNPEYTNKPLKYSFMKIKRIHNLDYYNIVDRTDNIYDSTFILNPDATIYKLGATIKRINIDCIKTCF